MRHRPTDRLDLLVEQIRPNRSDADDATSEINIESSDQLAIHLYPGCDSLHLDSSATDQSPEEANFSPARVSKTGRQQRKASPFPFMAGLSPRSQGVSSENSKVARRYSIEELLSMRTKLPFVICNVNKLNPKITSDIIKVSESIRASVKRITRSSRDLSSAARKTGSRSSHALTRSGESDRPYFEAKNGRWNQEDQEEVIVFRGNLALRSMEQKHMWMLRKRSSSDRLSQPLAAPPGYEAQKADNFKKFYAAVISPTHLRVTAGGRIVPNTRVLPHPTFRWNAENQSFESVNHSFGPGPELQKPWLHSSHINTPDLHSSMAIARAANEEFFGPPLHPRSSIRSKDRNDIDNNHSLGNATPDVSEETNTKDVVAQNNGDINATQSQIKISPPSQFDVFRPFFINGQPFYPASTVNQAQNNVSLLSFNSLGSLNASYPPLLPICGIAQPAPLQFQAGNFGYNPQLPLDAQQITHHNQLMPNPAFTPAMIAQQPQTQVGQPFNATPMMHLSPLPNGQTASHPQVAIMVNQIQTLQQQLKHLDNQLQNNKHQIDEQYVINQQYHVLNQIRALQSALNLQTMQPAIVQPEQYGSFGWHIGMGVPPPGTVRNGLATRKTDTLEANFAPTDGIQIVCQGGTALENIQDTVGVQARLAADSHNCQPSIKPTQSNRKRLSAAAAMAPEFQPRSYLAIASQPGTINAELPITTTNDNHVTPFGSVPQQGAESQSLSNVTNWSTPGQWIGSTAVCGPTIMPKGHMMHPLIEGNLFTQPTVQLQATASLKVPGLNNQLNLPATEGQNPYLTGYPPPGIPANSVKSADMIYSRELTEEELQARQIYWGNASRTLLTALPKFDGKDFYAPSPEKASGDTDGNPSNLKNDCLKGSNTSGTTIEQTESEFGSNNATLPLCHESADSENALPVAQSSENPVYKENVESSNSSPDFDTASLDAWGMVKADEDEIFDQQGLQAASFDSRVSHSNTANSAKAGLCITRRAAERHCQPTFLQDMLKNSTRTAMAASTGAHSSTTVRGYLPLYGGLAAASLAPSINNFGASGLTHSNLSRSQIENQPLPRNLHDSMGASAAEHLRKLKGKEKEKEIGDHSFRSEDERFGPAYSESKW